MAVVPLAVRTLVAIWPVLLLRHLLLQVHLLLLQIRDDALDDEKTLVLGEEPGSFLVGCDLLKLRQVVAWTSGRSEVHHGLELVLDLVNHLLVRVQVVLVLLGQLAQVVLVEEGLLVVRQGREFVEFVKSVSEGGLLTVGELHALFLDEHSEDLLELPQGLSFGLDQVFEDFARCASTVLLERVGASGARAWHPGVALSYQVIIPLVVLKLTYKFVPRS